MKITFSPLIAAASGKAADAVASSWHGRAFVRKLVIPKNPRSALQVAQRAKLARIPRWWRSMPDLIKGSPAMRAAGLYGLLEIIAKTFNLPAYSVFGKFNLQKLSDSEAPILVPGNPGCNSLGVVGAVDTQEDKLIAADWTLGAANPLYFVHPFTIPADAHEVDLEEPDIITYQANNILVATNLLTGPMTVKHIAKDYFIVLLVADEEVLANATVISGGVAVLGTSGKTP